MFRVGLTGGIASGKSTISQLFADQGIAIIDTDTVSHQLMQIDQAAYLQTVQHFGTEILKQDRSLNRAKLRKVIFNHPHQKEWLEKMLHPLIRSSTVDAINNVSIDPYVLVVVPLMFETGFNRLCDHIIAIDCPVKTQLNRLIQRDKIDETLALQMINSQMDNESRIIQADSIIQNLHEKDCQHDVRQLHLKLLKLAKASSLSQTNRLIKTVNPGD